MPPCRLAVLGLLALAGTSLAEATEPNRFLAALPFLSALPQGYTQRFQTGSVQGFWGGGSYGFRRVPLPFQSDLRLTLGRVAGGTEAGFEGRDQDTSFALGVFEPWVGADDSLPRVPRFQVVHDPVSGLQVGIRVQGAGALSEGHLGYGLTSTDGTVRVLGELGYGFQGDVRAPYVHLGASASRGGTLGPLNWNAGLVARAYIFPSQSQESVDLSGGLSWKPLPDQNLSFGVTHFDRMVLGSATLPDLSLGPDRVTVFTASYWAAPQAGVLRFKSIGYAYARHWLSPASDTAPLWATVGLDFGGSWLDLTPRYDFVTGEQDLSAAYLYRFGGFAAGPRLDLKRLSGVISWGVGVAVAPE